MNSYSEISPKGTSTLKSGGESRYNMLSDISRAYNIDDREYNPHELLNTPYYHRAIIHRANDSKIAINQPDLELYSPLSLATKTGKHNAIEALLECGADPLLYDCTGISPFGRCLLKFASSLIYHKDKATEFSETATVRNNWEIQLNQPIESRESNELVIL